MASDFNEVDSRLRSVLVDIANRLHPDTESRLEIRLSRSELARLTGTTLFTVSRVLCQWQSQGIVKLRRQVLEIISLEKLKRGGDDPSSLVPAFLKPRPSRNSGAVALPEPSTEQYD